MTDTVTTMVEIMDHTGHEALELTRDQTMALVEEREDAWVFAQGGMMNPEALAAADFETVGTIRVVPGLIGGLY